MKQIQFIFILSLFLVPFLAMGQRFNKLYPNESQYSFVTSIVEVDNGYVTCGQKLTPSNSQLKLQKIDFSGDTIWEATTSDTVRVFQPLAIDFLENYFYVTGTTLVSAQDQNNDGFLAKYDPDGNLIWIKQYGGIKPEAFYDVIPLPNNNLLLFGFSESYSPNSSSDFYMVKVDSEGTILWEKTLTSLTSDRPNSITKTDDGGYLMSGHVFVPATQTAFGNYDFLVIKTDATGNEIWRKKFGTDYDDNGGYVTQLRDGCYMASTTFSNSQGDQIAKLIKLDPNGEAIWNKNYPSGDFSIFTSPPIENEDGTFSIAEAIRNSNSIDIGNLIKISPTGNILWEKKYFKRSDIHQYIYNIISTSDGGNVFCGTAFNDSVPPRQEGWIVKTDCFGCDGELCDYTDSICDVYDCTQYPIHPDFTASDVNQQNQVSFLNTSPNTTSRTWDFGDGSKAYYNGQVNHTFLDAGTYTVTLTVFHGVCSETSQQTVVVEHDYVGIGELNEIQQYQIYPNPSTTTATVSFNEAQSGKLSVFSLAGRLVQSILVADQQELNLHIENWENGIYLVVFENSNGRIEQEKFVIVK